MSGLKARTASVFVGVALLVTGLVFGWRWAARSGPPVEYPADPADQPPAFAPFDASRLAVPGCPLAPPDEPPDPPGKPGDEKLVEWGAVRFVRCTYPGSDDGELMRIDVIDDVGKVTDAVRVLRRMLTPAQFTAYFGESDTAVSFAAQFPYYRYLFQFPDGHVTEVDYRSGYHRDGIVRMRWSVRGSSIEPLNGPGERVCSMEAANPCHVEGTTATIPQ